MTNMWSVKTVPNVSSLSFGFCFFTVARMIRIGSLMTSLLLGIFRYTGAIPGRQNGPAARRRLRARLRRMPHTPQGGPKSPTKQMGRFHRPRLKDDGFAIQAKTLPVYVRNLAEARVVLHRVDQHRHHVALAAARLGQLLEPPLHLGGVARGLEAADALDLLVLDRRVDLQVVDGTLLRHRVLVDADDDLLVAVLHELIAVGGVGDLA